LAQHPDSDNFFCAADPVQNQRHLADSRRSVNRLVECGISINDRKMNPDKSGLLLKEIVE